jgi:hypothetical protein
MTIEHKVLRKQSFTEGVVGAVEPAANLRHVKAEADANAIQILVIVRVVTEAITEAIGTVVGTS